MKRSRYWDSIGGVLLVYIGVGLLWMMLSVFYLAHIHPFLLPFHPALIVLLCHYFLSIVGSALLFALLLRRYAQVGVERERFLSSIFSSIQDGISISDTEMRVVRVNEAMERWYPHAMPIVGKKCYEAYHGRTSPCEVCPVIKTLATGEAACEMVPLRGADGSIQGWFDLFSFPMRNEKTGTLTGVIEYVRDITARKIAEERVEESEQFFRTLFESNRDAVMIADTMTGIILDANPQAEQLLRRPREELIGMDRIDLHPPDERERYQEQFAHHIRDGGARPVEAMVITKEGKRIPVEISASVFHLQDGKQVIQGLFRDISYRKWAEEALQAYSQNLERMVEERTCELDAARADLFASAKLAAMGRLGAGIAHQLNSPLGGGMLLIDALAEECRGEQKQLRMIAEVRRTLEQMHRIVESMLSMASIKRRGRPARMPVSLGEVIDGILSILLLECSQRGVALEKDIDGNLPKIPARVGELDQIFLNLINNAIEAMEGGGTLSVRAGIADDGGIEVRVADTGRGIPAEHLDQVFEPFFTTRKDRKGLGLGLAIAREVVDRYAGRISVQSEAGRGTEFVVWLPQAGLGDDEETVPNGMSR